MGAGADARSAAPAGTRRYTGSIQRWDMKLGAEQPDQRACTAPLAAAKIGMPNASRRPASRRTYSIQGFQL
jgi:hypothetical protein